MTVKFSQALEIQPVCQYLNQDITEIEMTSLLEGAYAVCKGFVSQTGFLEVLKYLAMGVA